MWSCETLKVGYEDVMSEALQNDEKALLTEIQDLNMLITYRTDTIIPICTCKPIPLSPSYTITWAVYHIWF